MLLASGARKGLCGPEGDRWDYERIEQKVSEELEAGSTFVLPLATIIETGNHIAFTAGDRYALAQSLSEYIRKTATDTDPWAAFGHQAELWSAEKLITLRYLARQFRGWGLVIPQSKMLLIFMPAPAPLRWKF